MPATSYEKLFDIQANAEDAFAVYLTANGLAAFTTRHNGNLPDARIIVHIEAGASVVGHRATANLTGTGQGEEDWFGLGIGFKVQTDRALDLSSTHPDFTSTHDYWVARLKVLMLRGAINGTLAGTTALTLPLYGIPVISYQGDQYDAADEALDETTIAYAAQVQIRADAWPVPLPPAP